MTKPCGCGGPARPAVPVSFCDLLRTKGATLPVYIADTAVGLNFQVALGGRMVDLFDALRTYKCPPSTITAAIFAMQGKIVQYREAATAAGLAGKTMTLGGISRLG